MAGSARGKIIPADKFGSGHVAGAGCGDSARCAVGDRPCCFRIPIPIWRCSLPRAGWVENRLAGSDVNPYLAIAASLACGYLGMVEGLKASDAATGSAYSGEFALHRHILGAIDAMRGILGDDFVTAYTAVKDDEYREFQGIITPYERDILMLNV